MGNIHTGMMSCARLWFVVILVALWPRVASAQGGPPLMTDDPDTPGPNHWEINLAMLLETSRLERRIDTPRLDFNFGLGRRIQLKFEVPWVSVRDEDNKIQSGTGNAVAGVKWRFVGQEGTRIAWSIYPQLEFNTAHGSVVKGIVEDGRQFLLPTELTVEFVHAEINGEVGRNFVEGRPDNWMFGVSTEGSVTKRMELLGELHAEEIPGEVAELFVNIGARPKLTRQIILLLAAGRTVHSPPSVGRRAYLYLGLQFNLPGQYAFKHVNRRNTDARISRRARIPSAANSPASS